MSTVLGESSSSAEKHTGISHKPHQTNFDDINVKLSIIDAERDLVDY